LSSRASTPSPSSHAKSWLARDDEPVDLVLFHALTPMHDAVAKRAEPAHVIIEFAVALLE
jgi:hypothetical protein